MLRSIAHVLIDPVNLVLLGVMMVYLVQRAGYRKLANYGKALLAGCVFLVLFTPYPVRLTIEQEHRHKPLNLAELPNEPYRVVVLGSCYSRTYQFRHPARPLCPEWQYLGSKVHLGFVEKFGAHATTAARMGGFGALEMGEAIGWALGNGCSTKITAAGSQFL